MRSTQDRAGWSAPTSTDEAHARAAGRRRHNVTRQLHARLRQAQVARLIIERGGLPRGTQAAVARQLGVSEATISRDIRALFRGSRPKRCPCCGYSEADL